MRRTLVLLSVAACMATPSLARDEDSTAFVARIQKAYAGAKNQEEVSSITMYCKAMVATFSFKERDRLGVQAIKLMEADKVAEANVLLKRVNDLEELDANLAKMVCKKK